MRRSRVLVGLSMAVVVAVIALFALSPAVAQGPGGPGGPGGMRPGGPNPFGAPDSFAADRDSLVRITMERIKGKENMPAESVFKNVQVSKGRTALQFLNGMNGLGRTLGVPCSHCHIENHWADEDKPAKQICRNMMRMTNALNDSLIGQYQWPRNDKPHVGCWTCHRGHANPNFDRPRRGPGGPGGPPPGAPRPEGERREGEGH